MTQPDATAPRHSPRVVFRAVLAAVFPLLALALFGAHRGGELLESWQGPGGSVSTDVYIPAVMTASGRGFVNVEPASVPGLRAFLDFQSPRLDTAAIPQDVKTVPLHPYQEYHLRLVSLVGAVWRWCGVSWVAVRRLITVMLVVVLWLVYAVSRLAMGRIPALGVAAAFAMNGALAQTLGQLRDFSKAPFVLLLVLLAGLLVRRRRGPAVLLLLSAGLGLCAGVGLGFRRDLLVLLPLGAAAVLLARDTLRGAAGKTALRIAALLLLGAAFLAPAWPVLRAFQTHGSLSAHDAMMGLATACDRQLPLTPASHEKLYLLNDLLVTFQGHDGAARGVTVGREYYRANAYDYPHDQIFKTHYLLETARVFPADLIGRCCASLLSVLGGVAPGGAGTAPGLLERFGAWAALLALAGLFRRDRRLFFTLAFFTAYLGAYPSLQFSPRHVFHLAFAPFFFWGMIAEWAIRRWKRRREAPGEGMLSPAWTAAACLLLLGAPAALWGAAAWWQGGTVGALKQSYLDAPRRTADFVRRSWDGRVLFSPVVDRPCVSCQHLGLINDFQTTFYVLTLSGGADAPDLAVEYEANNFQEDFSGPLLCAATMGGRSCVVVVPVYEPTYCPVWNRLAGFSLPATQADRLVGMEVIADAGAVGLPLAFAHSLGHPETSAPVQKPKIPWLGLESPDYAPAPPFNPFPVYNRAKGALLGGDAGAAAKEAAEALRLRPESLLFGVLMAEAQAAMGNHGESRAALERVLFSHGRDPKAGELVREAIEKLPPSAGGEQWLAAWRLEFPRAFCRLENAPPRQ